MKLFNLLSLMTLATVLTFTACSKEEEDKVEPAVEKLYKVEKTSASYTATAGRDTEISPKIKFTNTSSEQTEFVWVRKNEVLLQGWSAATCDNIACHDPIITKRTMTLEANESFDMKISFFFPDTATSGDASADIVVYQEADSAATATVLSFEGKLIP